MFKLLKKHPLAKISLVKKPGKIGFGGFLRNLIPVPGVNPMMSPKGIFDKIKSLTHK